MSRAGEPTAPVSRRRRLLTVTAALALGVAVGLGVWAATRPGGDVDPAAATAGLADRTVDATAGTEGDDATAGTEGTGATAGTEEADGTAALPGADGSAGAGAADGTAPGANSPGIEAAPDADPDEPEAGTVGALPSLPALQVAAGTEPASAVGSLVEGFPSEIISLAPSSTVLSSSVSSDGQRLQAAVEATDTRSVDEVLASYGETLGALGFAASQSPATAGSTAVTFTRSSHVVVVSARPQSDGALFTVAAVLDETS